MKWIPKLVLTIFLGGCAHLSNGDGPGGESLWEEAHKAVQRLEFRTATANFERLATEFPATMEGREARFFLGALYLDPRNPGWDPRPAQSWLDRYQVLDTAQVQLFRQTEASVLLALARQLNMPADQRISGMQPETRVVTLPPRVIAPASEPRALREEMEVLRRQLAERDETIQRQREELERIRRTLTPSPPAGARAP